MSASPGLVLDERPAALSFPSLLDTLAGLGVSFRCQGDRVALKNADRLSAELLDAAREHQSELLSLCRRRELCELLHARIVSMRCGDPPRGTRGEALAWLESRIARLAEMCEGDGWAEPGDEFAGDQVAVLRSELAEIAAGPYPLGPLADDPFGMDPPRLYNGKEARPC